MATGDAAGAAPDQVRQQVDRIDVDHSTSVSPRSFAVSRALGSS
jgi:hypothetical protein